MKDSRDPLSSTLQSWRHEPSPAPAFNKHVWARIRSETAAQKRVALFNFSSSLPLAAGLAILFAVAAGSGTAFALNQTRTADRMATAYVRSIDPVQMTATHLHP
jgi:hypothetical protein